MTGRVPFGALGPLGNKETPHCRAPGALGAPGDRDKLGRYEQVMTIRVPLGPCAPGKKKHPVYGPWNPMGPWGLRQVGLIHISDEQSGSPGPLGHPGDRDKTGGTTIHLYMHTHSATPFNTRSALALYSRARCPQCHAAAPFGNHPYTRVRRVDCNS